MRRSRIRLAALAGALLVAAPAPAQEPESEIEAVLGHPKRAPVIPPELAAMVRISERDRLVVRGLDGADIPIDIAQMEPENFARYGDGRFFGFSFIGYEFYGYVLVDRAMQGTAALFEIGVAPAFSPDGRHFAAVQFSGAGFGNLEAFGLWTVGDAGTAQAYFTDVVPEGQDWRIDGWPRADCLSFSMVEREPEAGPGEDYEAALRRAPRRHFGFELGPPLALHQSYDQPGCNTVDATSND